MNDVARAAAVILEGGLVVYPTDTLYGLGASALDARAVQHVYEVKQRPRDMPLPVAVGNVDDIETVAIMTDLAWTLAEALLPGALTLVLRKRREVPRQVAGDTVAVRVPGHPVARRICRTAGPVTATSANLHGGTLPADVAGAREQLGGLVDLYLDGGRLPGVPSTVVDATGQDITVIREGAIAEEHLYDITC
ncbi:MAG: L-threonylcarbamoyladenylate synthase [Thermoplasmatota archaeon]